VRDINNLKAELKANKNIIYSLKETMASREESERREISGLILETADERRRGSLSGFGDREQKKDFTPRTITRKTSV
jgi:hypothetical protein